MNAQGNDFAPFPLNARGGWVVPCDTHIPPALGPVPAHSEFGVGCCLGEFRMKECNRLEIGEHCAFRDYCLLERCTVGADCTFSFNNGVYHSDVGARCTFEDELLCHDNDFGDRCTFGNGCEFSYVVFGKDCEFGDDCLFEHETDYETTVPPLPGVASNPEIAFREKAVEAQHVPRH